MEQMGIMTRKELRLPNVRTSDMTHTTTLRSSYQKKLINLFNDFNNILTPGLIRMLNRNILQEYATRVKPGFMKEFSDKIDNVADQTIYNDAPRVVKEGVTLSYKIGKQRAVNNSRVVRTIKISPSLSIYDNQVLEDLKTRNLSLITKLTEDMKTRLLQVMIDGIKQGTSTTDIARNITKGIEDISRPRAEMIARTEIAYSYNTAIGETYKHEGISEWQWLATLGTTCCEECANRHGNVYRWSDEQPPAHPNCLCTIYPVVELPGEMPIME